MKKHRIIYILLIVVILSYSNAVYAGGMNLVLECPLGADVTKDLSGALNIFRIIAPILCVAFSIFEAVSAIAKGDAATDMKKVAKRFAKRIVFTLILFFLTIIVDAAMQLFNVWDADGGCTFDASVNETRPSPSSSDSSNEKLSCNQLSAGNCGSNPECGLYMVAGSSTPTCQKRCSTFGAGSCPSDRCTVRDNKCYNK